jgi:adenylate cyclase
MPRLVVQRCGQENRIFELPEARAIEMGRAQTNDLVLADTSVSRRHATLTPAPGGGWRIIDRGSANGISVNGLAVPDATLRNNVVITIGAYTLRFETMNEQKVVVRAPSLPPKLTQMLSKPVDTSQLTSYRPPSTTHAAPGGAAGAAAKRGESTAALEKRLETAERENQLLTLLYEVNRSLGELNSTDEVIDRVLELVLQLEGVERACVMLLDANGEFLPGRVRYRHQVQCSDETKMMLSQSIIRQVMKEGTPVVVEDAQSDARFLMSRSVSLAGIHSAMCAPLRSHQRMHGLLYVDNLSKSGVFSKEDLNVFAVIAGQAGLTVDDVRARQEVAQRVLQQAALERFLSPAVAKKIVSEASNLRLGGEMQEVTVLFSDIRGFTRMSEAQPPDRIVEILNEYFNGMTELLFENHGTLDKYLGDGLMCLFGAPLAQGQDALRAVRTAVGMQHLLEEINRQSGRAPLAIGIGINSGPVVAGYIGAARRLDYTAIGDTVNVASRLTDKAQPGQILVSQSTWKELAGEVPGRELPPLQLKGKSGPVPVFEILWREARTERSRAAAGERNA